MASSSLPSHFPPPGLGTGHRWVRAGAESLRSQEIQFVGFDLALGKLPIIHQQIVIATAGIVQPFHKSLHRLATDGEAPKPHAILEFFHNPHLRFFRKDLSTIYTGQSTLLTVDLLEVLDRDGSLRPTENQPQLHIIAIIINRNSDGFTIGAENLEALLPEFLNQLVQERPPFIHEIVDQTLFVSTLHFQHLLKFKFNREHLPTEEEVVLDQWVFPVGFPRFVEVAVQAFLSNKLLD